MFLLYKTQNGIGFGIKFENRIIIYKKVQVDTMVIIQVIIKRQLKSKSYQEMTIALKDYEGLEEDGIIENEAERKSEME